MGEVVRLDVRAFVCARRVASRRVKGGSSEVCACKIWSRYVWRVGCSLASASGLTSQSRFQGSSSLCV